MSRLRTLPGLLTLLLLLSASLTLSSCANSKKSPPDSKTDDGTSSGGGGFGDQNSMMLLNRAKQLTADSIRRANPEIFKTLPKGWTQERFAKLIEDTHAEPNNAVYRYNRELMFDYKIPKKGEPYLIATALFFRANSAVPVNGLDTKDLEPYLREMRIQLLREAAHVLSIGTSEKTDYKARVFSLYVSSVLNTNNYSCWIADLPENHFGVADEYTLKERIEFRARRDGVNLEQQWLSEHGEKETGEEESGDGEEGEDFRTPREKAIDEQLVQDQKLKYYWLFNRTSGFGLYSAKSFDLDAELKIVNGQLLRFLEGQPMSQSYFTSFVPARIWSRPAVYDLERFYSTAPFQYQEFRQTGVISQYFPDWLEQGQGRDAKLTFGGSAPLQNEKGEKCLWSETFTLPKIGQGKLKARYDYVDTCYLQYQYDEEGNQVGALVQPVAGSLEMQCTESFKTLTLLKEFYGDKGFQDSLLVEWAKNLDKLD